MLYSLIIILLSINIFSTPEKPVATPAATTITSDLYSGLGTTTESSLPSADVFSLALKGYSGLKNSNRLRKDILTIIDMSLPSTEKRLWVIDMGQRKVLFNELVAHGKNTGDNMAGKFSNTPESNMSSLGFYVTGETYTGSNGLSLCLDGLDNSFNDNARRRAIVMHGAEYVSQDYIRKYGRIGRSFGCPALSREACKPVIETISQGSCLFIYYPDEVYLKNSGVLNGVAANQ
jgi:hypothetical protein